MRMLCAWVIGVAALIVADIANATNCSNASFKRLQFFSNDTGGILWQTGRVDSPLDPNTQRLMIHLLKQDGDDWAGAYSNCSGIEGKALSAVRNLSFDFLNTSSQPVHIGAGAPRYTVEIDTNGDNVTDVYAYLAAFYCEEVLSSDPRWSRADFTGRVTAGCSIWTNVQHSSDGTNSAWAALAAAYPTGRVLQAYLVMDEQGTAFVDRLAFYNKMYIQNGSGSAAIKNCPSESSC